MSNPDRVKLSEIEARKDGRAGSEQWQLVNITLDERAAMTRALRIMQAALQGLATREPRWDEAVELLGCVDDLIDFTPEPSEGTPTTNELLTADGISSSLVAENKRLRAELGDEGYDDRWLCDGCGGVWESPDDDLTVGMRYRCVGCGEVTLAISERPNAEATA